MKENKGIEKSRRIRKKEKEEGKSKEKTGQMNERKEIGKKRKGKRRK